MDILKIQEANTKIIGKQICYRKEFKSTHMKSKQIVKKSSLIDNGSILLADRQTDGIGTHGRNWYTGSEENIAMTIILMPKCDIGQLDNLTITVAESMQKAIKELYGYNLEIRNPNDLMLNGKKISGILTEVNTVSGHINYLLISIGFNVNEEKFSDETKELATSLKAVYHKDFSREEIIKRFIEILEENIADILELEK